MPDIDIDFEDTRREKVIQYVQENMVNSMFLVLLHLVIYLLEQLGVMSEELWALMKRL